MTTESLVQIRLNWFWKLDWIWFFKAKWRIFNRKVKAQTYCYVRWQWPQWPQSCLAQVSWASSFQTWPVFCCCCCHHAMDTCPHLPEGFGHLIFQVPQKLSSLFLGGHPVPACCFLSVLWRWRSENSHSAWHTASGRSSQLLPCPEKPADVHRSCTRVVCVTHFPPRWDKMSQLCPDFLHE